MTNPALTTAPATEHPVPVKIGVPMFGYQHFDHCQRQVEKSGFFTANLGDNMQSIAIRKLLKRCGVADERVVSVNRDTLASYNGEPLAMIMNGVFPESSFPIPAQVTPIFIGLCVREPTIERFRDFFIQHQPIGCRDITTQQLFEKYGVQAYVTGCLTLSLPNRSVNDRQKKVFIVYGGGSGNFPSQVLRHIPHDYLDNVEFIYHRLPLFDFPLDDTACHQVEAYSSSLLRRYAAHGKMIITPLHHVAAPCMAMGIPVIICRDEMDGRFSFLQTLTPIYTPDQFAQIDWHPQAVDTSSIRSNMQNLLRHAIRKLDATSA